MTETQKTPFFPQGVEWEIEGVMRLVAGGILDIGAGGELRLAGTKITVTAATLNALMAGAGAGYKVARGQHTTVAASDTVVTGLTTVVAAVATLDDDPSVAVLLVSCSIGNQTDAPAAGSILIKSWKPTAVNDVTPIAATTFSKKVNWVAIGT